MYQCVSLSSKGDVKHRKSACMCSSHAMRRWCFPGCVPSRSPFRDSGALLLRLYGFTLHNPYNNYNQFGRQFAAILEHMEAHTHTHDPRPVGYVERALSIKTRDYFSEPHRSLGTGRSLSRARSIHTKPLFYEPHRTSGAGRGLSRGASSLLRTQISCSTLSPHAPFPITRRLQSCHTSRAAHCLDLARPRHTLPRHPLQSSSRG